jgi:VanZ family protein
MQKKIWKWCNAYVPPIAWATVIFIFSSQSKLPSPDGPLLDFLFKKSAHMFVYAVLYFLLYRGVNLEKKPAKNWWLPFILCFAYAAGDEFHQSFTPHRTPTIRDIGFDMIGAWVAFLRIYQYI